MTREKLEKKFRVTKYVNGLGNAAYEVERLYFGLFWLPYGSRKMNRYLYEDDAKYKVKITIDRILENKWRKAE